MRQLYQRNATCQRNATSLNLVLINLTAVRDGGRTKGDPVWVFVSGYSLGPSITSQVGEYVLVTVESYSMETGRSAELAHTGLHVPVKKLLL